MGKLDLEIQEVMNELGEEQQIEDVQILVE